jgi:hypothetical protein
METVGPVADAVFEVGVKPGGATTVVVAVPK